MKFNKKKKKSVNEMGRVIKGNNIVPPRFSFCKNVDQVVLKTL